MWDEIDRVAERAGVHSPTGAIQDVIQARGKELEEYLEAFPCRKGQRGLLVLINGRAAGMDLLSKATAYKVLHPKLLKSYAMEAFLAQGGKPPKPILERAKEFLSRAVNCEERKYRSVGLGWDYRFLGKRMLGSALVYRKAVVHAAFFEMAQAERTGRMAGLSSRRGFRGEYVL